MHGVCPSFPSSPLPRLLAPLCPVVRPAQPPCATCLPPASLRLLLSLSFPSQSRHGFVLARFPLIPFLQPPTSPPSLPSPSFPLSSSSLPPPHQRTSLVHTYKSQAAFSTDRETPTFTQKIYSCCHNKRSPSQNPLACTKLYPSNVHELCKANRQYCNRNNNNSVSPTTSNNGNI